MTTQRQLLVAGLLFSISLHSSAQTTFQRTFGGIGYDRGLSVQQTSDGGYVIVGEIQSVGTGPYRVYLIKTNAGGDTLWTRMYKGSGDAFGASVRQTNDGGFIAVGYTYPPLGTSDVYLIRTNASGDTLWTKTFGGPGQDEGHSVQQTNDGGYVIAGLTYSFGAAPGDIYLIKTNSGGDTLWTRTLGGSNQDFGYSVQQTSDSGYVVAGFTLSFGAGGSDVWLIRTNAAGDTLWTKTFGGSNYDRGSSVQQTSDGGYVVAGVKDLFGPSNVYLIKTDNAGNTLWTKTLGGTYDDPSVWQTTDNGYVITASVARGSSYDAYLIRTNASGDTLWTRTFGGSSYDGGRSVQQTSDGGYVIAGVTSSFGAGLYDVYLIKTNANGVVSVPAEASTPGGFALEENYPNPFNPVTTFQFSIGNRQLTILKVYDVLGQEVATLVNEVKQPGTYKVQWDASGVASGVYFYQLQSGEFLSTKKLILIR